MDEFQLALAHYRLVFADLESLGDAGANGQPTAWWTVYNEVASGAMAQTLVLESAAEGTRVAGARNFDQLTLLRALHARRAELDPDYIDTAFEPAAIPARQFGVTLRV